MPVFECRDLGEGRFEMDRLKPRCCRIDLVIESVGCNEALILFLFQEQCCSVGRGG